MPKTDPLPSSKSLFHGLRPETQKKLQIRDYTQADLDQRLRTSGVEVKDILDLSVRPESWIPGLEILPRRIYRQRLRGHFGEIVRLDDLKNKVGFAPKQWSSALMYAGTTKGFHIHPPHIPEGYAPKDWFRKLFVEELENHSLRNYEKEQWEMSFFLVGTVELFLVDERDGMPRRKMRLIIDGDDSPGDNNAGVIIPPGVAHGFRAEGSQNLLIVYGTSTTFRPESEGRLVSDVEIARLDDDWVEYLND